MTATQFILDQNSLPRTAVTTTSAYSTQVSDSIILASGTFSVTLPLASSYTGRTLVIKNTGAGTITVSRAGSDTIDGATSDSLPAQYQVQHYFSNGTAWYRLCPKQFWK